MAGLLAWAADVVGGGGSGSLPVGEEERVEGGFELTAEQQEQMRRLDSRAWTLQREIQQLRQSLPPSHIAQRLPYLHADSLTSQSALALELHAHSATRLQLQIREASLQSENAAYAKALAATQQQANEKAQEAKELEACFEEMHDAEQKLRAELYQLQTQRAEHDNALKESQISQMDEASFLSSSTMPAEELELQSIREELESWQSKVSTLQEELSFLQQTSSRWPSSVQREKDLERRLRSLTEQLVAKQVNCIIYSFCFYSFLCSFHLEQLQDGHNRTDLLCNRLRPSL
ncbi:hypothetical protein O6H91_05G105500 [Diphasiastrum complanatum]|uniref:Uncharacterized protein n=1 Tax=Diphasiastrum complanatum TaxID=34168 RepID=A0ACC2DRW2_DIPCM|nr:hypothetical protein O6H91_05G105500 [Diphasiastrum complanatum]